jgi:hypothetical protein
MGSYGRMLVVKVPVLPSSDAAGIYESSGVLDLS